MEPSDAGGLVLVETEMGYQWRLRFPNGTTTPWRGTMISRQTLRYWRAMEGDGVTAERRTVRYGPPEVMELGELPEHQP